MLDILSQAVINQRAAEIRQDLNSVNTLLGTVNSRLSKSWADRVKHGADRTLAYLDTKVSSRADGRYYTNTRAGKLDKLDNLNASITSRAAQSTVNDIRTRVIDCQNKNNKLLLAPEGGACSRLAHDKNITVSGSGVLRLLTVTGGYGRVYLKIDGKVIYNWVNPLISNTNLAAGGIRFTKQLHIAAKNTNNSNALTPVAYAYTKGD